MFNWLSKWMYTLLGFIPFKLPIAIDDEINIISSQEKVNENKKISNFFVLGDSLSDPGNLISLINETANKISNNVLCPQFLKNLCEPYQKDILASQYFENRFTNSLVFTEIIAGKLNIESKRAWNYLTFISINFPCWCVKVLVSNFISCNNPSGNNYALANAKATNDSELYQTSIKKIKNQIWKTIFCKASYQQLSNLTEQFEVVVNNFLSLNNQTETLLKQHKIKENDLIFICIAGNDIIDIDDFSNQQQVDKIIDKAVDGLKNSIERLILNQAKRIIVTNVVDIGKIPARLNYFSENYSQASCLYNEKWENMIDNLQEEYPSVIIQKFNLNQLFIQYLQVYEKQGKNITSSFVSYEERDFFAMLNGEKVEDSYKLELCEQENYFFFDKIHPSKKVHELIAEELFKFINDK